MTDSTGVPDTMYQASSNAVEVHPAIFPTDILSKLLSDLHACSPFYREHFAACPLDWDQPIEYSDFRTLPYLERDDVEHHSARFRCPDVRVTRVFCSSGTLGTPKAIYYTTEDWKHICAVTGRHFVQAGIVPDDVAAIMLPLGLALSGPAFVDALADIRSLAIPFGLYVGDEDLLAMLERFQTTVIGSSPSNLCRLTAVILKQDPGLLQRLHVRIIIVAGENLTEEQRHYLSNHWGAQVLSAYGSSENGCLGYECPHCLAIRPQLDSALYEVITEQGAQLLAPGLSGEVVVTNLHQEGTPMIRYRLGDIVQVVPGCSHCDPAAANIRIIGRSKPAVTLIEGTKLYSYQIEEAIKAATSSPFACQVTADDDRGRDALHFVIFCDQTEPVSETRIRDNLMRASLDFSDAIASGLVAKPTVELRALSELEVNQRGKAVAFRDIRASRRLKPASV